MTSFERMSDNPESELERMLLVAGRRSLADDRMKAETLAVLGITGAATVGFGALTATLWKKAALFGLVGSIGVGGAVTVYQWTAGSEPNPGAPLVQAVAVTSPASGQAPHLAPQGVAPQAESAEASALVARPAKSTVASRAVAPKAANSIREEVRALDDVRSALAAGNAGGALHRLSDYDARFAKGSLRMEAAVLRVRALAEAGRVEEASRQAKRLVQKDPNGVLATRLRRYILP